MRKIIKSQDKLIVYTTGVFDLIHPGHLNLLKKARALGHKLIVGVQEDDSVEEQKGKRPIMACEQRMAMLEVLPFVDIVFSYSDLDQRKMLELYKPDIMVQGGDWMKTGDRTEIIEYLQNHNIRLAQFPYTKGISSTEIKEKIYLNLKKIEREKSLEFDLYQRLKLVPINNLITYEDFDPSRTNKLVKSMSYSKVFFNPLTVGDIGRKDRYLVIDGANRLEALKKLKASYAFVQIVDYLGSEELELKANEHYLNCSTDDFIKLMAQEGILIKNCSKRREATSVQINESNNTIIFLGDDLYTLEFTNHLNFSKCVDVLNKFVRSYKNKLDICRKSEAGDVSKNYSVIIKFVKFTTSDIIQIVAKRMHLESGITWHVINNAVIRFKVPIDLLITGFNGEEEANLFLQKIIKEKIEGSSVRRYMSNVYVCDEWDL